MEQRLALAGEIGLRLHPERHRHRRGAVDVRQDDVAGEIPGAGDALAVGRHFDAVGATDIRCQPRQLAIGIEAIDGIRRLRLFGLVEAAVGKIDAAFAVRRNVVRRDQLLAFVSIHQLGDFAGLEITLGQHLRTRQALPDQQITVPVDVQAVRHVAGRHHGFQLAGLRVVAIEDAGRRKIDHVDRAVFRSDDTFAGALAAARDTLPFGILGDDLRRDDRNECKLREYDACTCKQPSACRQVHEFLPLCFTSF